MFVVLGLRDKSNDTCMKNKALGHLLFLLILAIGGSNTAIAQDSRPSTPEERAMKVTDWMKSELHLNVDQEPLIHTINLKYATENESLRTSSQAKLSKYRKFKTRQDAKDGELKRVLTPEQFNTYLDKRGELKKKMKEDWKESRN